VKESRTASFTLTSPQRAGVSSDAQEPHDFRSTTAKMAPTAPLSARPLYTSEQIHQFYDRISLPQQHRHEPGEQTNNLIHDPDASLGFLAALQRHCLASIPFENLALHYSTHHTISLDPDHLFEKIIASPDGRGGYCMENNKLMYTILKTLGFDLVSSGARVNEGGASGSSLPYDQCTYNGWSHMINIVTIPPRTGEKYFIDVGFGSGGPSLPIKLEHDKPVLNVAPSQTVRLRYDRIPEHTTSDDGQKLWIFEKKDQDAAEFRPMYCFLGTEFLPQDYEVMNLFTSQSRTMWFTRAVCCVKWLLSEDGEEVVGDLTMMQRHLKRKVGGKVETVKEFQSEQDRIDALKKYLGVTLNEAEKNGIKGMVSEIK